MLITTLPPLHREDLLHKILSCPDVAEVRYNTGVASAFSPKETLEKIKVLADRYKKKVWIDLKGRQLRVKNWAQPDYGKIVLNHEVEFEGDAFVQFRGDPQKYELRIAQGDTIFVDPVPRHAVGEGQSVNIIGENVKIKGYLTKNDENYVDAGIETGMTRFMLSFVEDWEDIEEVFKKTTNVELGLKIESPKGRAFVESLALGDLYTNMRLVAARDDFYVTLGENKFRILDALEIIAKKDPQAILASRIFSGLMFENEVSVADLADVALMKTFGYRDFMFSDEISLRHFPAAIAAWKKL